MISGVAQVMGMKPIFRSFFSSAPVVPCAIACSDAMGSTLEMAAIAVLRPTAFRKRRRSASCGNSAFTSAASTKLADSASKSAVSLRVRNSAAAWSAALGCWPQAQCISKGRSAS